VHALDVGLQVAVADRTALILDIFSQRARTREGKLQVCMHTRNPIPGNQP
jgi:50S ribosomal subunit-associated GTPase HflX